MPGWLLAWFLTQVGLAHASSSRGAVTQRWSPLPLRGRGLEQVLQERRRESGWPRGPCAEQAQIRARSSG